MRRLLTFTLALALLLPLSVQAAEEISLPQSDGGHRKLGGNGDRAKTSANLDTLIACERLQDQASKGHCVIVDAANLAVISKTTAATIGGGVANDTYLKRVIVLAALTGTCVIAGFADSDGAAQSFTIPAAFVGERNFGGAKNSAGALTVTCSNAADDNLVLVEWWPAS